MNFYIRNTSDSKKEAIKKDLDIPFNTKEEEMELDKNAAYERISSSSEDEAKNKKNKKNKKQEAKTNKRKPDKSSQNILERRHKIFLQNLI